MESSDIERKCAKQCLKFSASRLGFLVGSDIDCPIAGS